MTSNTEDFIAAPDSLKRQDIEARHANPESISTGTDFGSYARANRGRGLSESGIEHHNLVVPVHRVRIYRDLLGTSKIDTIADLGCGLGFTSSALAIAFATSSVTGYEVSTDACEFACRTWTGLKFVPGAVIPNSNLGDKFDLIVAQEFYPFTRTDDAAIHASFIDTLTASLTERGLILITLTEGSPDSILGNTGLLEKKLASEGFSLKVVALPFDRVYAKLPSYMLAKWASGILSVLLKKPRFVAVTISR